MKMRLMAAEGSFKSEVANTMTYEEKGYLVWV